MTKIKLCGLKRACDIEWANELKPDYIGFVFAKHSRRFVSPNDAGELKKLLHPSIKVAGVFVDAEIEVIANMVELNIIDVVQLHGSEDEAYLRRLKERINVRIFQAFCIKTKEDVKRAEESSADMVLLDAGSGCGEVFDWSLLKDINRPYFLAGGLTTENVADAIDRLHPYGVDVSSALEIGGMKDSVKMAAFVKAVRGKDE